MPKDVLIGYCHASSLAESFAHAVIQLVLWDAANSQRVMGLNSVGGAYMPESRNRMAEDLLKSSATWLFSLDHDMLFSHSALDELLAEAGEDKKILGALYLNYYSDGKPYPTWLESDGNGRLRTVDLLQARTTRTVATVGMGGTLIHRSVFEAMRARHATTDNWIWYGHDQNAYGERMGEDVTFCLRAAAAGFKVWGTTNVQMGHLKVRSLDLSALIPQQTKPVRS